MPVASLAQAHKEAFSRYPYLVHDQAWRQWLRANIKSQYAAELQGLIARARATKAFIKSNSYSMPPNQIKSKMDQYRGEVLKVAVEMDKIYQGYYKPAKDGDQTKSGIGTFLSLGTLQKASQAAVYVNPTVGQLSAVDKAYYSAADIKASHEELSIWVLSVEMAKHPEWTQKPYPAQADIKKIVAQDLKVEMPDLYKKEVAIAMQQTGKSQDEIEESLGTKNIASAPATQEVKSPGVVQSVQSVISSIKPWATPIAFGVLGLTAVTIIGVIVWTGKTRKKK